MGTIYYAPFDDITVTTDADQDIWEIGATSSNKIALHGWELTSAETTAENVDLILLRRSTSGNGVAVTEVRANPSQDANTSTVEQLATAPGTAGDIIQAWKWEQQGPVGVLYTPEMRPIIGVSTFLSLNLNSALGGTRQWSGWICWEEL